MRVAEHVSKISEEEFESKTGMLLEEYFGSGDLDEALQCIKELKSVEYHFRILERAINLAIEKKEKEREDTIKLLDFLHSSRVFSVQDYEKGYGHSLTC